MISKKTFVFLGVLILLLWLFQFLFPPAPRSSHINYVGSKGRLGVKTGTRKNPFTDLQTAINHCKNGDTLIVLSGTYEATSMPFREDLCGNCEKQQTAVDATYGFLIKGVNIAIIGYGVDKTFLVTNAGYGVLFLNSEGSTIEGVTITGGKRDIDGNATDAGIVVKFSSVIIRNCRIRDNTDRPEAIIVGIGGIMGREGAEIFAFDNEIINNGWDGIALYRGAMGYFEGNIIREGRGAGIGITWDAVAIAYGNEISHYWKGIGAFGDSRAIVKNNIVRDCLGWGIIATGNSYMDACNNVVYHNGNCGLATWSETASGRFSNNIVALNGWKEQWVAPRVGLQNYGGYDNFEISYNNIWNNEAGNYGDMPNLTGLRGNISVDPKFINADSGNFRLLQNSPCIDCGNPAITDMDGSVSDIGAIFK